MAERGPGGRADGPGRRGRDRPADARGGGSRGERRERPSGDGRRRDEGPVGHGRGGGEVTDRGRADRDGSGGGGRRERGEPTDPAERGKPTDPADRGRRDPSREATDRDVRPRREWRGGGPRAFDRPRGGGGSERRRDGPAGGPGRQRDWAPRERATGGQWQVRPPREGSQKGGWPERPPRDRTDRQPWEEQRSRDRVDRAPAEERRPWDRTGRTPWQERPPRDRPERGPGSERPPRPWTARPPRDDRGRPSRPERRAAPAVEPSPGLVAEGEELIAGRRPVEEAFAAGRPARRLLVVPHRRTTLEALVVHATRAHVPVIEVEGGTLTALAGFDGHQGVALVAAPRRWASIEDALARAIERDEPAFLLALDSIEDPRNLGALLRSAEAAGVHGVVLPTQRAAPLTAVAVKASAGASEHLSLLQTDDLPGTLAELHARGVRLIGADATAPLTYREADLRGPLAIVVGSEGQGLSAGVRRRVDLTVRIPMRGRVGSLNASVAGSILLFEVTAQRGAAAPPPPAKGATGGAGSPEHAGEEPGNAGREPAAAPSPESAAGTAGGRRPDEA